MRVSVSRTARRLIRARGGRVYLWEQDGEIRVGTTQPDDEAFVRRDGDGFEFQLEQSLECPGGIHVGLRPWLRLFAREGPRGGSVLWRALAVERHVPDGGVGSP
jgi:hypothetical protein